MGTSSSSKGPKAAYRLSRHGCRTLTRPRRCPKRRRSRIKAPIRQRRLPCSRRCAGSACAAPAIHRRAQVARHICKGRRRRRRAAAKSRRVRSRLWRVGTRDAALRRNRADRRTLYGALSPSERGQTTLPGGTLDAAVLSGRSANEVMDAVVEAVRPTDGTQDAEASRVAIKDALSELLTKFPDAVLLELTEAQRLFAVERYVALDVFRRFMLDVGKTIQDKAPTAKAGLARLKEAKDYIKETVAAAFKKVGASTGLTRQKVVALAKDALKETFAVFESYVK